MIKLFNPLQSVGWNYLSIPNLNGAAVEVWERNLIPYFTGRVIIYQSSD